jgi:hypothetical protein
MTNSPEANLRRIEARSQAGQAKANPATNNPTIQEVKDWDANELLQWIQKERPKLLTGRILDKFKEAYISGYAFLRHAGDEKFFRDNCQLPPGISDDLASLAEDLCEKSESSSLSQLALTMLPPYRTRHQATTICGRTK